MTVKELKIYLNTFDENLPVHIPNDEIEGTSIEAQNVGVCSLNGMETKVIIDFE